MQQKWGKYCWFISTYPIIIYPSFRCICKEIPDIAKFQIVNSCSSSQADNKSEDVLFPWRYQPMPLMPGKGERIPERKTLGHCSWLLQPGSGCPEWSKEGAQDTVGLKRQSKSMSGIAGHSYHEICLVRVCAKFNHLYGARCRLTWSKSVNGVMQAVGVAKCFSSFANWWS